MSLFTMIKGTKEEVESIVKKQSSLEKERTLKYSKSLSKMTITMIKMKSLFKQLIGKLVKYVINLRKSPQIHHTNY